MTDQEKSLSDLITEIKKDNIDSAAYRLKKRMLEIERENYLEEINLLRVDLLSARDRFNEVGLFVAAGITHEAMERSIRRLPND